MPELNLNYAPLPPWLAENKGKPEFWEAKAAGQRDRQLGMQEQELESRLISAQQDQQLSILKQAEIRRLRDETIEAELAVQEKAPYIASLMRQGKTEKALQEWQALGIENGKVRASKSYGTMADDLRFALQVKENARLRAEMEKGRNERAEEANDLKWEIKEAELEAANDPTSLVAQQRLTRALLQERGLRIGEERLVLAKRSADLRTNSATQTAVMNEATLADKGFTSTVPLAPGSAAPQPDAATQEWLGPGNATQPQSLLRPVARPLTPAVVSTVQASMRDLENSHSAVQRALQSVESTPEAFGPLGPAREALEIARTMLFPGQPAPISSARTTADSTAEDIIRGLKQDSQMSVFEKKQLDRIARITGMADTPDRAKAKLNVVAVGIAGKAIRDAKLRHVPPPAWAVRDIEAKADLTGYLEDDLVDAVNQGYITQQRGLEELRRRKQAEKE